MSALAPDQAWEPYVPLTRPVLPAFPADVLPPSVDRYVTAVASSSETPRDLGGVLSLAAMAACVAKTAEVSCTDGTNREPLNLMVFIALPPGERKSAVFARMFAPLEEQEQALREAARPKIQAALRERASIDEEITRAKRQLRKGSREDIEAQLKSLAAEREALVVPEEPRLLADDITPETVPRLLAGNGGRLCIASPEGGLLDTLAGRYSKGIANIDVFLKGHAGETVRIDRKGAEPVVVPGATLTVAFAAQPTMLAALHGNGQFQGRGFVARFLVSTPAPRVGTRTYRAPRLDERLARDYGQLLKHLLARPVAELPPLILLSDAAREVWCSFAVEVERRCGDDGDLVTMPDWVSKLPGAVARIAAVLHLAEHAHGDERELIALDTLERAVMLGRYFLTHAHAVYAGKSNAANVEDARHLLVWVRSRRTFSVREVQRSLKRFTSADQARAAVQLLFERGYVRPRPAPEHARGRPPNETYDVHPDLSADEKRNASESR